MTAIAAEPVVGATSARPIRTTAILAVLLTAQMMSILDVNIVNVAAATIRADLSASGAGLQLVVAGYMIAYAITLITGARIGGIAGPRRTFLAGLATFTVASLACALAGDTAMLIAFRFIQGVGAAFMIPQVFSLIQRHFVGPARVRALGYYAAVIAGGVVVGQVLGGLLVDANLFGTGWRPIFFINVPIGLILLVVGRRVLPADTVTARRPLDLGGLTTLAAAVLAFVTPLLFGHEEGWPIWGWVSLGASVLLFAAFVVVQRRVSAPLMPARVVGAPGMIASLIAIFGFILAYGGYLFAIALHLQAVLGFSPLHAGLSFVPMAVPFAVSSLNWRRLPERWHGHLITIGGLFAAVGLAASAATLHHDPRPGVLYYLAQALVGFASGAAFSPLMARALGSVRPADAADASGLVTTMLQLGQVVGVAVIGSFYLALHGAQALPITLLVASLVTALATTCAAVRPSRR